MGVWFDLICGGVLLELCEDFIFGNAGGDWADSRVSDLYVGCADRAGELFIHPTWFWREQVIPPCFYSWKFDSSDCEFKVLVDWFDFADLIDYC